MTDLAVISVTHNATTGAAVTQLYKPCPLADAQRVAVRERYPQGFGADKVSYLLSDHLGSTSVTADADGNLRSRTLYSAWGEIRHQAGALPTDYTYTGQYSNTADFGLMYYRARWYDPSLGRFSQADTVVPLASQGSQAWDRYAYVNNNPLRYSDASGHCIDPDAYTCKDYEEIPTENVETGNSEVVSEIFLEILDEILWTYIPSAVGIQIGVAYQDGVIIEPAGVLEKGIVFNWRSGELSQYEGGGGGLYIGSPGIFAGNVYIGVQRIYGVSRNDNLNGGAIAVSASGGLDAFGKIGGNFTQSAALGDDSLYIDPESNRLIQGQQANVTVGGNLGANGLDFGLTFLLVHTQITRTVNIYNMFPK